MIKVIVNATSANLAVGFDTLGLALDLNNEFIFNRANSFKLEGFKDEYNNEDNLLLKGYKYLFEYLNEKIIPVSIKYKGSIPIKRGLGSSSSLIVGGLYGANAILGYPLEDDILFNLAAKIEGHPDNVCPAIFGGLSSSYRVGNEYRGLCYKVGDLLSFAVLIPPYEVETAKARTILPKCYSIDDIVYTSSRLVALPKAFMFSDINLLIDLMDDKIHEPYRAKLIDGYYEIKEKCKSLGIASAISGSGSSILLISDDSNKFKDISYKDYKLINLKLGSGVLVEEE